MSRFPFPIPFGWFHVGNSNDLATNEIKPVRYFDRDLVLWRDAHAVAHLQSAYCPHLGANLSVGGKVKGELIECPFHNWRWNGEGKVAEIDYASKLNTKACLRTYPLQEYYGLLMAWYHPHAEPPLWEIPRIAECEDDDWVGPLSKMHTIKTCLQEMAENTADAPHFVTIHKHPGAAHYDTFEFEGPSMIMRSTQKFPSSKGPVDGTLDTTTLGFGWSTVRYNTLAEMMMLTTNAPIDGETVEQHFHVWYKNPTRDAQVDRIGQAFHAEVNRQLTEDIPIWENKIYQETPHLCDKDGPIGKFRKWCTQFYAD